MVMVAVERKQQKCGGGGKACGDGKKGEGKVKKMFLFAVDGASLP